jgi:hypothetical protein
MDFYKDAGLIMTVVLQNRARYGCGDGTPGGIFIMETVNPKYETYKKAHDEWENPGTRTSHMTLALHEARKEFEPQLRKLAGILKHSILVTNEDLDNMGLPTRHDPTRTPPPVATRPPLGVITLKRIASIQVDFYDDDIKKKRRPRGQHGVECLWGFSETPVESISALPHSRFDTRTPMVMDFPHTDRGKTVYLALRWENTRGDRKSVV